MTMSWLTVIERNQSNHKFCSFMRKCNLTFYKAISINVSGEESCTWWTCVFHAKFLGNYVILLLKNILAELNTVAGSLYKTNQIRP